MLPVGVEELVDRGHRVLIESGAGVGSGLADEEYALAGAELCDVESVWEQADLVVKVKEPQPSELQQIRSGQTLFTYFHLAADENLTRKLLKTGSTCVAYETLRGRKGDLPLLAPMKPGDVGSNDVAIAVS